MATDVVMPQMGESITEGTIVRWMKKVGDRIDRDEPLLEITTDKVDAEIPSPAAGVVVEILAKEGETVSVNHVRGRDRRARRRGRRARAANRPLVARRRRAGRRARAARVSGTRAAEAGGRPIGRRSARDRTSPLVRKIAKEHHVDISQIHGTGISGRVTKYDILTISKQTGQAGQAGPGGRRRAAAAKPRAIASSRCR